VRVHSVRASADAVRVVAAWSRAGRTGAESGTTIGTETGTETGAEIDTRTGTGTAVEVGARPGTGGDSTARATT